MRGQWGSIFRWRISFSRVGHFQIYMTSRRWCFTLNNPQEFEYPEEWSQLSKIKFIIYQMEKGEETGTEHLQGYLEVKVPCRLTALKRFPSHDPRSLLYSLSKYSIPLRYKRVALRCSSLFWNNNPRTVLSCLWPSPNGSGWITSSMLSGDMVP